MTSAQFDRLLHVRVQETLGGRDPRALPAQELRGLVGAAADYVFEERVAGLARPWMIIPKQFTLRDHAKRDPSYLSDYLVDLADEVTAQLRG